ncbi:MAG: DUF4136 domain-containing protein [Myxococcota bacterium]
MKIEVRSDISELDPRVPNRVAQRVRDRLRSFSLGLQRVVVRLRDLNGPRGGRDKECLVQLECADGPSVVVREREDEVMRAVQRALARTRRTVGRRRARRTRVTRQSGLLGVLLFSAACAGPSVEVGSRSSTALSSKTTPTYKVLSHSLAREPESDKWIEDELHRALQARGFKRTAGNPSLIVDYKLLVDEREVTGERAPDLPMAGAMDAGGLDDMNDGSSNTDKILVVTVQDADSLELLWVGWSKARVSAAELPATTRAAVEEIMKRLPTG